jgi:hypothetical protein
MSETTNQFHGFYPECHLLGIDCANDLQLRHSKPQILTMGKQMRTAANTCFLGLFWGGLNGMYIGSFQES